MSDPKEAKAEAKAAKAKAKALRPWFKKKRFWVLGLVVLVPIAGALSGGGSSTESSPSVQSEVTRATSEATAPSSDTTVTSSVKKPAPAAPKETVSQENARKKAESYLDSSAFSRKGLIEQLEFEGFSNADSTYAVDAIDVDWNEQAAKKAESYLEFSSFSRSGLIDQLLFEGFTQSQAEYGVGTTGL
jgi:hypothetical protein